MSWQRFLPPALFFPFLAYIVFGKEPVFFTVLIGAVVVLGLLEFYNMAKKEDWWFLGLFLGILMVGQAHQNGFPEIAGCIVYILISGSLIFGLIKPSFIALISRFSVIAIIFGLFYIAFFVSHLILIRNLADGKMLLLYFFFVVWSADGFAYLIGKRFGKHKGIFSVSPNKSIEGLLGGFIIPILVSLLLRRCVGLSSLEALLMGALLSVSALLGDLAESSFKRNIGAKDSGNWIMEYGGILDVFDSIILSAPLFYYLYLFTR